ncbi:MAG: hypothetical protein WAU10_06975, partial [Caldilineaceae bacterium]
ARHPFAAQPRTKQAEIQRLKRCGLEAEIFSDQWCWLSLWKPRWVVYPLFGFHRFNQRSSIPGFQFCPVFPRRCALKP